MHTCAPARFISLRSPARPGEANKSPTARAGSSSALPNDLRPELGPMTKAFIGQGRQPPIGPSRLAGRSFHVNGPSNLASPLNPNIDNASISVLILIFSLLYTNNDLFFVVIEPASSYLLRTKRLVLVLFS